MACRKLGIQIRVTLTVPAALEEIVQRFDAKEEPFTEFDIGGELKAARGALVDPLDAENLGAWAEVLAFALSKGDNGNPWNTYFGPMGSGTNAEGQTVYFPDIAGTPPEAVSHWGARARSLKHPFLKARYADLVWDMSGPITQMIFADDRVAAKIGSVEDDSFGRLFHQAKFAFQFEMPWLAQAFRRLFEKHEVVPEHFAGWANRHRLFGDMSLLVEGLRAWTRNDNVKAAHVLVPQVERALRKITDGLGLPTTKAHPRVSGTSVAIGMGEILYNEKVAEALGPDATLHFQALYAEPRGMNLRNEIAHGLMDSGQFYWRLGNLIVHSLTILGLWKEFGGLGQKRGD
jgi:hypothetical protein